MLYCCNGGGCVIILLVYIAVDCLFSRMHVLLHCLRKMFNENRRTVKLCLPAEAMNYCHFSFICCSATSTTRSNIQFGLFMIFCCLFLLLLKLLNCSKYAPQNIAYLSFYLLSDTKMGRSATQSFCTTLISNNDYDD